MLNQRYYRKLLKKGIIEYFTNSLFHPYISTPVDTPNRVKALL